MRDLNKKKQTKQPNFTINISDDKNFQKTNHKTWYTNRIFIHNGKNIDTSIRT